MTDGVEYPPPPWQLAATMLVSVFAVPSARLPAALRAAVPGEVSPVRLPGRALVGVAFADYAPGGVLAYRELLVALPGRRRAAPCCSVGQIWVDSRASRAGARQEWAIPKELAAFTWEGAAGAGPDGGVVRCAMVLDGRVVAGLRGLVGRRVAPGVAVLPVTTAQRLDGRTVVTRSRAVGRVRSLRCAWTVDPAGPLGYLAGRTPWWSLALTDASVTFGLATSARPGS